MLAKLSWLHRSDGDGEWMLQSEGGRLSVTHDHGKGAAAVTALDGLTAEIPAGQVTGLVGDVGGVPLLAVDEDLAALAIALEALDRHDHRGADQHAQRIALRLRPRPRSPADGRY